MNDNDDLDDAAAEEELPVSLGPILEACDGVLNELRAQQSASLTPDRSLELRRLIRIIGALREAVAALCMQLDESKTQYSQKY